MTGIDMALLDPCETCGTKITGWRIDYPYREVTSEMVPAWEGGPLVEVPLMLVRHERTGPPILTVEPCGHQADHLTQRTPPEDTDG